MRLQAGRTAERDTQEIHPSPVCPWQGKSELLCPTDRPAQSALVQASRQALSKPCSPGSHSAACGERNPAAALQRGSPAANRSSQGMPELPHSCHLAHRQVSRADQILGNEELAFQTCFSFLHTPSFSCPDRKGQCRDKKNYIRFFSRTGILLTFEVTNFIVVH